MEPKSKSALEKFFACPKSYEYAYVDGYEPKGSSEEMRFGTAGHAILEQLLKEQYKLPDYSAVDLGDFDKQKLKILIDGWLRHTGLPDGVQQVEHPWKTESAKGVFDMVRRGPDQLEIWEHKFTKSLLDSDNYWDKYRFDWQVGLYQVAARAIFGEPAVVVLNALRVPQQRKKSGETVTKYFERVAADIEENPEAYYRQARIRWSEESLARIENEVRELADRLPQMSYYPRSRRCLEWGRQCGYYGVCFEGKSLTDTNLYQLRSSRA